MALMAEKIIAMARHVVVAVVVLKAKGIGNMAGAVVVMVVVVIGVMGEGTIGMAVVEVAGAGDMILMWSPMPLLILSRVLNRHRTLIEVQ